MEDQREETIATTCWKEFVEKGGGCFYLAMNPPQYPFLNAVPLDPSPPLERSRMIPVAFSWNASDWQTYEAGRFSLDTTDDVRIFDFGVETVGYVEVDFLTPEQTELEVRYGEVLREVIRDEPPEVDWYVPPVDLISANGECRWRCPHRRAFRYLRFRLLRDQAKIEAVRVEQIHMRVENVGCLKTSDSQINNIWGICERTLRLCMQGFYEDGIKRDGLLWVSDYRAAFLSAWPLFGDSKLARRSLQMIARSQRADGEIPACNGLGGGRQHPEIIEYMPGVPDGFANHWILYDYSGDFLHSLVEYWMHTGDFSLVRDLQSSVSRLVTYLIPALLDFDPTVPPRGSGERALHGACWAQGVGALEAGARLAELLEDPEAGARCRKAAAVLRERILHQRLRDGMFLDDASAASAREITWPAAIWNVLFQSTTEDIARQALENIAQTEAPIPTDGWKMMNKIACHFEMGQFEQAVAQMRSYWGFMLDHGATTAWEHADPSGKRFPDWDKPLTSRCHAWSAGACYLVVRYILGIKPVEPGFSRVSLSPQACGLNELEAVVATPYGELRIEWSGKSGRYLLPDPIVDLQGRRGEIRLNFQE